MLRKLMTLAAVAIVSQAVAASPSMAQHGYARVSNDGYDRWVRIVNTTGSDILRLYATNVHVVGWGRHDLLGEYVIPSGYNMRVLIDDGEGYCLFDLRAEFADGSVAEDWRVNVCEIPQFTY